MAWHKRDGFSLTEMVVACGLLAVVMSIVGPLTITASRLANQSEKTRRLTDELDNQLERLVVLPDEQLKKALQALRLAEDLAAIAPASQLNGTVVEDKDGPRIQLTLVPGPETGLRTVTMVGWRSLSLQDQP